MMRQTGGTAVGEISTRSSPFCLAIARACGGGMMPSCVPVSSITRISRTRMRSLTRTRSSRRGLLSKAINASLRLFSLARDLVARRSDEPFDRARALIAALARPHRHRAFGALAVADHQHVGHLLQLGLPDLISDLFLALVQIGPQARLLQLVADRRRVRQVPV